MELDLPVAVVYGEVDDIMPSHQGMQLSKISEKWIPVYVIGNSWHMPFSKNAGKDVVVFIEHAEKRLSRPLKKTHNRRYESLVSVAPFFSSHFSLSLTQLKIERLYSYLNDICGVGEPLLMRSSSIFFVDGAD